MKKVFAIAGAGVLSIAMLGAAVAQDNTDGAVNARSSIMQLYGFHLGTLGAMAKGSVDYDAAAATKAANNLVLLTQLDQSAMWPMGSDNVSNPKSRALPAIWENFADVGAKSMALTEAALAMQVAAGQDLDALRGAMGAVGGACSACHKAYRGPRN